jgi:hypothetical protein
VLLCLLALQRAGEQLVDARASLSPRERRVVEDQRVDDVER